MLKKSMHTIWVLQGPRAGDNDQAHELASLLEAQVICKHLKFNRLHYMPNLVLGASTCSLELSSKKELLPPWPDLVIATGKRSCPVARWIKQQSLGKTKIVQLGRPRVPLFAVDLVITTPQYGLPSAANVIELLLPFATPRKMDARELSFWRTEWADLRRPLIAVTVGNAKFPLRMGRRESQLLGQQVDLLAEQMNGSLLLIASPRSVPRVVAQIEAELSVPHIAYRIFDVKKNPYHAALAVCDHFVATSDSISMISELITTGKPVDVFELPDRRMKLKWRASTGLGALLSRSGVLQPPRDVSGLVRALIDNGHVNALGEQRARIPFEHKDAVILDRLNQLLSA